MASRPSGKFLQTVARIGPTQVISAADELFNHVDANLPMWSGEGDRKLRIPFLFSSPFEQTPALTMGVIGIDCDHASNLRYHLAAENVSKIGFDAVFVTWDNTHIARASISWQAIGKKPVKVRPVRPDPAE